MSSNEESFKKPPFNNLLETSTKLIFSSRAVIVKVSIS
jgi:hypothetical protein